MGYLYVFDYGSASIYEIKVDTKEDDLKTNEELLEEYGLKEDDCYVMFTEKKLEIEQIEKIKK